MPAPVWPKTQLMRRLVLDRNDTRQLAHIRSSGAVEGDAGGGSVTDQSNKMANTVAADNRLPKTYNPTNVVSAPAASIGRESRAPGCWNRAGPKVSQRRTL
jgi:hypothetical protein